MGYKTNYTTNVISIYTLTHIGKWESQIRLNSDEYSHSLVESLGQSDG